MPTKTPESVALPEDLGTWIQERLDENVSRVMDDDVLEVLTSAYLDHKGKWVQAKAVLKKAGFLSDVQKIVKTEARRQMTARVSQRQRRKVETAEPGSGGVRHILERLNFEITEHVIFQTRPRRHRMTVKMRDTDEVHVLEFDNKTLTKPVSFETEFRDCADREAMGLPLPRDEWRMFVDHLVRNATKVEMSRDSSEMGRLLETAREKLWDLPLGESAQDLRHLHIVPDPQDETGTVYLVGRSSFHEYLSKALGGKPLAANLFALVMELLGARPQRKRVSGEQIRVFAFPWKLGDAEGAPPSPAEAGRFRAKPTQGDLLTLPAPAPGTKGTLN